MLNRELDEVKYVFEKYEVLHVVELQLWLEGASEFEKQTSAATSSSCPTA
jgi:hypothetical protein